MAIPAIILVIPIVDVEGDGVVLVIVEGVKTEAEIEVIVIEDDDDEEGIDLGDLEGPEVFPVMLPTVLQEPIVELNN